MHNSHATWAPSTHFPVSFHGWTPRLQATPPVGSWGVTSHGCGRREGGFKAVAGEQWSGGGGRKDRHNPRPCPVTTRSTWAHGSCRPVNLNCYLRKPLTNRSTHQRTHIPVIMGNFLRFLGWFQLKAETDILPDTHLAQYKTCSEM